MSSISRHYQPRERHDRPKGRTIGRRTLVWLLVPLLLAGVVGSVVLFTRPQAQGAVPTTVPADRFIQSIVTDDGALGWHQLCPDIQARLSIDALVQQANAQRAAVAQQHVRLTMKFVGTQPQQGGGEQRVYLLTAYWPNGMSQQRTFTVLTQPSGCVEDVQNQ
jgi:hypothetical protein